MKENMWRRIFTALLQFLAIAVIILSLKPRIDLLFDEYRPDSHYNAYAHGYWNYFIIQSWLIALAGIGAGLILFWISGLTGGKPKAPAGRLAVGRIAFMAGAAIATILLCAYAPGLSGIFGVRALDHHVPMELTRPANGMVFMVLTNELGAPKVEYNPPPRGTLLLPTNSIKPD